MNSRQSAESDEYKIFRKKNQKPAPHWKVSEGFFLRRGFLLLHQSKLKVKLNKQFYLTDNDAQRIVLLYVYLNCLAIDAAIYFLTA